MMTAPVSSLMVKLHMANDMSTLTASPLNTRIYLCIDRKLDFSPNHFLAQGVIVPCILAPAKILLVLSRVHSL